MAQRVPAQNVTPEEARWLEQHADALSDTTLRAKWIHSLDEHEDRPGQSLATRSREVIRHWAEQRQAKPATVPGTEHGDLPGVLRFQFAGYGGESLEAISWDEWFRTFNQRELVFVFQEHQSGGNQSNFFMFDSPRREHE